MRIGFIGRTKSLFDTIRYFKKLDGFEISFIWTCKDENYYNFESKNFEELANKIKCPFVYSSDTSKIPKNIRADIVISINFITFCGNLKTRKVIYTDSLQTTSRLDNFGIHHLLIL